MGAVIAGGAADQHRPLRLVELVPVATRDLGGRVDRVAAARRQEDPRRHRRPVGQDVGEFQRGAVGEIAERRVGLELTHLGGDRRGDLGPAVADVCVPEARRRIQIAVAVVVPHPHVLATLDHKLVVAYHAHVGERVPETRVFFGGHATWTLARGRPPACRNRRVVTGRYVALLGLRVELDRLDHGRIDRPVLGAGGETLDRVDGVHPGRDLAEHGVLAV